MVWTTAGRSTNLPVMPAEHARSLDDGVDADAISLDAPVDGLEAAPDEPGEEPMTLYLVKRLEMLVRSLMDDALRIHGVTTLQYTALSVLARHDGMSSAALSRRSFVTPQTMNEMVLWFERRGLVARERDPQNRRVLLIHLTEDGRRVVADCTEIVRELEERVHSSMDDGERVGFRQGLSRGYRSLLPLAGRPGAANAPVEL